MADSMAALAGVAAVLVRYLAEGVVGRDVLAEPAYNSVGPRGPAQIVVAVRAVDRVRRWLEPRRPSFRGHRYLRW